MCWLLSSSPFCPRQVLVTFFATYALVILPFEKRRGPFVASSPTAFAQAAEQTQPAASQVGLHTSVYILYTC